jgi:hypothetical protein
LAGPPTAARAFHVKVAEKITPLRYRLQSRHYDLFLRARKTPDKVPGKACELEDADESCVIANEELLGKEKGLKRKKVFGLIQERTFPKVAKVTLGREMKKLGEVTAEMDISTATECFSECAGAIQRTLSLESASSLLSFCPVFFSKSEFLQKHMFHLTGGNDIFVNCSEHFEFQMELIYQGRNSPICKNYS